MNLILVALRHDHTQQEVYRLSQNIVTHILNSPATTSQVVELLRRVLADPSTQDQMIILLQQLIANPTTRDALAGLTTSTLEADAVQEQVNSIAAEAVHVVLNDPKV